MFKYYTNEHHRRGHEGISDSVLREDWNCCKAEAHTSKNGHKAGYWKVAFLMGFCPSCALNKVLQKCNFSDYVIEDFFSVVCAQRPEEGQLWYFLTSVVVDSVVLMMAACFCKGFLVLGCVCMTVCR